MYSLRSSVRACVDHGAIVFLDLARDRYFAVEAASAPQIKGISVRGDGSATASLMARNLVEPSASESTRVSPALAAPTGELDALAYRKASVGLSDWARMLYACARASYALRRRRLDLTFAAMTRRISAFAETPALAGSGVAKFEFMRPWYPRRRVCLFDSLALVNFLLVAGCAPRLVMGVRAKPFAAHCWVETDGVCLNDAAETCRSYTPIAWVG